MSGPRGAVANCGLVLKKLDFSIAPNYPTNPALYTNLDQLNRDVQQVQNLLTDPLAGSGWCEMIADVIALAGGSTAYFSDTSPNPNPARDEFLQDFNRVKQLAGCP